MIYYVFVDEITGQVRAYNRYNVLQRHLCSHVGRVWQEVTGATGPRTIYVLQTAKGQRQLNRRMFEAMGKASKGK